MIERRPLPDAWPHALAGLGERHVIAFASCRDCEAAGGRVSRWVPDREPEAAIERTYLPGTWIAYGSTPLCLPHALERIGRK